MREFGGCRCISPNRKRSLAYFATPTESNCCASRLPLHRPETGPSHGSLKSMRRCGKCGPSTPCFRSRESGRRRSTVSLLVGGMGILRSMLSRQVFPSSADSPVFSLLPPVTRSVLVPRPAGTARLCFALPPQQVKCDLQGTPALRAPCGFRFPENLLRTERAKHFPDPPKKRRLPLGAGHLTSLRARVSRRQSGQIQTGEKQWHSTETTSR
jgi:hypothetical protein